MKDLTQHRLELAGGSEGDVGRPIKSTDFTQRSLPELS